MDKLLYETGFGLIPKSIMCNPNLSIQAKSVFAYLASFAGNGDTAFPSRSTIMYHLGIGKDSLTKYIKELKDSGYLEVIQQKNEKGKFSHNVYKLNPCPKLSDTDLSDTTNPPTNINSSLKKTEKKKKKEEKETTFDKIIETYTNNDSLKERLIDFIKMRKAIKSPMTNRALTILINKLDKLAVNDEEKIMILDESILNSWKGVFPLKKDKPSNQNNNNSNNEPRYDKNGFEIV